MGACMSRSAGGAVSTAEPSDASGRGESTRAAKARSYDSTSSKRIPIFGSGRVDCPVNRFFDHVQNNPLVLQLQEYRDGLLGPGETREETPELCTLRVSASTVPVPPMNIVIMIVGTRGDVHPFFGLGHLLQQDGHRVRIATHVEFEKEVKTEGFEFYPLGGDPRRLSAFMVETSGRLLPNLMNQSERAGLPEKMNMLNEIIQSTWPACTAPEPSDPKQTPFIADAIISNPVTYAHIHCAEALSVPLHLFFPQPWTPTHEFPHPFASMSYERGWCAENWYSYHMVDYLFHMGVSGYINDLRVNQMGLDPIRRGEHGFNLINNNHVPFVKMWSPNLVPKPKDWGPYIDVTGAFFTPPSKKAAAWEPPQDLVDFLAAGEPPIFVGFGSMVIDDVDSLLTAFLKAVEASGARMVLQSQWTAMIDARRHEAPPSVYPIGPAPHEWLLPRMGAVVHHGGAGTVAAGLRAGKPTLICPFFGDQFFWGQYVYERGVGPKPIPIRKVDAENLTAAFQELRAPEVKKRAEELAALMAEENGLVHGLHAFYRHLPVEDMVCEVSIFSSSTRIARCWCKECGLKMSWEADTAIHELSHDDNMRKHKREDYRFVNWGVLGPRNLLRGAREGIGGFAHELVAGVGDLITKPVEGFYREGATGVIKGAGHGAFNVVRRPIRGGIIFADKLATGGHNMIAMTGNAEGKQLIKSGHITRRYLFYDKIRNLEHMAGTKIFRQPDTVTAMNVSDRRLDIAKEEVDTALCLELRSAHACAMRARKTFDQLAPNRVMAKNDDVLGHFIQKTVNYSRQADIDVPSHLTPEWMSDVIEAMDTSGDGFISFPEFCMFLKALKAADEVAAHETKEEANRDLDLGVSLETRLQTIKCLVGFQAVHGCVFSMSKDASPPPSPRVPLTREPSAADAAAAAAEPDVTAASAAHSSYAPSRNAAGGSSGGGGGGDELSAVPAAALDDFKTAAPINDATAATAAAAGSGGVGGASAGGDSAVEGFAAARRGREPLAALSSSEAFGAGASSYVTAVGAHSDIGGSSDDSALRPAAAAAAASMPTDADAVASAAAAAPGDSGSSDGAPAAAARATSDDSVTGGFGSAGTGAAAAAAAAGAAAAAAHGHSFTAAVEAIARKSYTAGAAVGAAAAAAAVRASHMGGGGGGAEADDRKPSIAAAAAAAAVAQQHGSYGGDVTGGTSDIAEAIAAATAAAHVWGDVRNSPAAAPP